jgi:hypothetical protein
MTDATFDFCKDFGDMKGAPQIWVEKGSRYQMIDGMDENEILEIASDESPF